MAISVSKRKPAVSAKKAELLASTSDVGDNVVPFAVEALKPEMAKLLIEYDENKGRENNIRQNMAYIAIRHHEGTVHSNVSKVASFAEMFDGDTRVTNKAFTSWVSTVQSAFGLVGIKNKKGDQTQAKSDAKVDRDEHRKAVAKACKLAALIGASGGTSADYDTKARVFRVKSALFIPRVEQGVAGWAFVIPKPAIVAMDNKGFALTNDTAFRSQRFSMERLLTTYYAKPEKVRADDEDGDGNTSGTAKGADDLLAGMPADAKQKRAWLDSVVIDDRILSMDRYFAKNPNPTLDNASVEVRNAWARVALKLYTAVKPTEGVFTIGEKKKA